MGPGQAPPGFVATSILQDTLIKVLVVLETIAQRGRSFGTPQSSHIRVGAQTLNQQPILGLPIGWIDWIIMLRFWLIGYRFLSILIR